MIGLEPEDEITSDEDLILLAEVRARIAALKPYHVEDTRILRRFAEEAFGTRETADSWLAGQEADLRPHLEVVTWSAEEEELLALKALEAAMAALGENTTAINEGYVRTVVEDDTEDITGAVAIEILGEYVDWERMTEDRKAVLTQVMYRGTGFYLEGR
jgi:hypothetical protein